MRVSSMPRPCAHSSSAGNSSSFTPLSATALILTLSPAACAASTLRLTPGSVDHDLRVSRRSLYFLARSFRVGLGSIADRDPVAASAVPQIEAPTQLPGHH